MAAGPKALSDRVSDEQLDRILQRITINAEQIDALVFEVVDKYCEPVDKIIQSIQDILQNHKDLTDRQLDLYVLQIPGELYYVNTATEFLGIRDDVSKLIYKESYNQHRAQAEGRTVAEKDAEAELLSSSEALACVIYTRAFRIVKNKMDMAFEMLQSLKKVVSHRMTEKQLANSDTGGSPT